MTFADLKKLFKKYRSESNERFDELEKQVKEMSKDIKALKSKLHVIENKDECG